LLICIIDVERKFVLNIKGSNDRPPYAFYTLPVEEYHPEPTPVLSKYLFVSSEDESNFEQVKEEANHCCKDKYAVQI